MKKSFKGGEIMGEAGTLYLSEGIIYEDREKQYRSGHLGHAMAEFAPGKIIDFAPNTSAERFFGHAAYGWMEYRISEDYGKTFSRPKKLPYSWETFLNGNHTVSVEKAVACNDGTIVAFCLINDILQPASCEPWSEPTVVRSKDGGKTWEKPQYSFPLAGRIYDAIYRDGIIYVLEFCNDAKEDFTGSKPEHQYRIYCSKDNGVSFYEQSVVAFPDTIGRAYGTMVFTPEGKLRVYAYNLNDQANMDYAESSDNGKTWKKTGLSYVAQQIRNPQIGILNGQYILHGRAGEGETGVSSFVLYTSKDGIKWDEGHILVHGKPACFYSNNLVMTFPDGTERMLVQYSENICDEYADKWSARVNVMHLWIKNQK